MEQGTEAYCQRQLWTPSPGTGSTARGFRDSEFSTDGSSSLMRSPLSTVGGMTLLMGDSEMHVAITALCFSLSPVVSKQPGSKEGRGGVDSIFLCKSGTELHRGATSFA